MALAAAPSAVTADPDDDTDPNRHRHDHDRARRAVERGEARPLSDILTQVRPALGGEVAGVDFRRKSGRWIYEFRVLSPAGQMTEVYVDASTADILKREPH